MAWPTMGVCSGRSKRFALRGFDGEQSIQTCDLQQLHQSRANAAQDELAVFQAGELLVHREHDADRLAGEILHALEIENDLSSIFFIDEAIQLLADLLEF